MNTALRRAMQSAGLTPRQLANRVGVTTKTVERWVADQALSPHAQNREDAAQALGVEEHMLWPKAHSDRVKVGTDREIIHSYPYRSACPSTVWADLISRASQDIVFAGYTNYFLWTQQPRLADTLRAKAGAGCRVRFLLGAPDNEVTRRRETVEDVPLTVSTRIRMCLRELEHLGPVEGIEARYWDEHDAGSHIALSVFRLDSEILVTPHLARLVGHVSPLLHLRRQRDGGMFDRFVEHTEELWSRGCPVGD